MFFFMFCFFLFCFFFFFSSRRRHTRFSRDWSSDVCSSDLVAHLRQDDHGRECVDSSQGAQRCQVWLILRCLRGQLHLIVISIEHADAMFQLTDHFRKHESAVRTLQLHFLHPCPEALRPSLSVAIPMSVANQKVNDLPPHPTDVFLHGLSRADEIS